MLKEDKAAYIQALIDTREGESMEVFMNCMSRLHCQHLRYDIDQYLKSVDAEMVDKKETKTETIVQQFGFTATTAKRYLRQLTEFGYLAAKGGNRNRTYTMLIPSQTDEK